ncbi:hypothetical protein SmJEL517_g02570 [Synchytrium microbalum]|uniref:Uncharacterized protein n=1 Tax=Synchytrium microbalum TaxID=1806994 RepID=A0A507CBB6_9FUNG|nr:uncharacterized protein SmJEL517_g02570 [Synchytrium microbalum]TPX34835.1 hypothetical protein SmJEL517_g02570 [Synchytrium microbalum]
MAPKKRKEATPSELEYDDLVELASDTEEKGERYKGGEKALRFYLKALDLYNMALKQKPNDLDVVFNVSRLRMVLAEMKDPAPSPQERTVLLHDSASGFRFILATDARNADVGYMLATTLFAQAESSSDGVMEMLEEASSILDWVFVVQYEKFQNDAKERSEISPVVEDAPPQQDMETDEPDMNVYDTAVIEESVTESVLSQTLTTHAEILILAFSTLLNEELYLKALGLLDRASVICPSDMEVWVRKAELVTAKLKITYNVAEAKEALAYLDAVIGRDEKCVEALTDKGDLMWLMGENGASVAETRTLWAKAAEAYTAALALEPCIVDIAMALADCHLGRMKAYEGENEKMEKTRSVLASNAAMYYQRVVNQVPTHGGSYLGFARATSYIVGREEECRKALRTLRKMQPWVWSEIEYDDNGVPFSENVKRLEWFKFVCL